MTQTQQMILMATVFFTVTGSVHYYLWLRMIRDSGLPSPWREIATILLVMLWLSIPVAFVVGHSIAFDISRVVTFVPYLWLGMMMLLFFSFLSIDIVKLLVFAVKKVGQDEVLSVDHGRRRAFGQIIAGTTVLSVAGMATAGVARAARKAAIKPVDIAMERLPRSLNGLKIVQISDLHIGITVGEKWLDELVTRINGLKPDIVAITGDLVDGHIDLLRSEIAPLARLEAARGVYFVTGNHEYYSGVVQRWMAEIERLGVTVLRNEAIAVGEGDDKLYIAGVDDYTSKGMAPGHGQDIGKAMKGVPAGSPVVLLAHQPKAVIEAAEYGVDLVLSGHTHGGQIFPFNLLVGLQQPYNKGWYRHSKSTQIYVNQGTFIWGPPMRLGTECEITALRLQAA